MGLAEAKPSSNSDPGNELPLAEIKREIRDMGSETLMLLRGLLTRQLSVEELSVALRETGASALLFRHWSSLIQQTDAAAALEILQLIAFLPDQVEYQVARYGASSLADDRDQLLAALSRLS